MYRILMTLMVVFLLCSCKENKNQPIQHEILTVKKTNNEHALFFNGVIEPSEVSVVTSPVNGVVSDIKQQYGEWVNQGDLIYQIHSTEFFGEYKNALMQFVKCKSEYTAGKILLSESEFLHKNKLISDDEFQSKKSNYYTTQLAFIQAKDALSKLLTVLNINDEKLYELNIADIQKINAAMHLDNNNNTINIFASAKGVLLFPSNKEDSKKLMIGSQVKQGDVVAMIGNMSGFKVTVLVNEMSVNLLTKGLRVTVEGPAFSNDPLIGEVSSVDKEAVSVNGSPMFNMTVAVSKIKPQQLKNIHVGMSAKIKINIQESEKIVIPFAAVFEDHDHTYVHIIKDHILNNKIIRTGDTTTDGVVVLAGLAEGDHIASPY